MQRQRLVASIFLIIFFFPVFIFAQGPFLEKTLKRGSSGDEVRMLQIFLAELPGIYPEGLVTGYFGVLTEAAVKRFQARHNIVSSGIAAMTGYGIVGPRTRGAINGLQAGPPPPPSPRGAVTVPAVVLQSVTPEPAPYFTYSWKADATLTGEVTLPTPVAKPVIVLNGQKTIIPQTSAAVRLAETYNIVLVDQEEPWDEQTATMMLEMMRRVHDVYNKSSNKKTWRVAFTNASLVNDVEINSDLIRFSKAAFTFSNPTQQSSGTGVATTAFYSNRLFRAVLKTFFNDRQLLEVLLKKRYGVVAGFAEPRDEFQEFTLDELQYLATVFEDLPSGFHHISGLEKVVRRKNGLVNPISPMAPAIAWVDAGYIEFMDKAFGSGSEDYIRRLIAHEMTHFVWHKILTEETKAQFMKLSGWSKTLPLGGVTASTGKASDHPKAGSRTPLSETWYRTTTTNFVSDYSAYLNPDEDFAETVSHYIYLPDRVRTIAPEKYNFVKNVVNGYEYVILVDEKYTFQVFNLEPDTTFPGKIVGTDIQVYKQKDGSNKVVITLHLSPIYGDGAEQAYSRITSPTDTFFDVYYYPVNGDKYTLQAGLIVPKTAASGYWLPDQITVSDRVDNRRQEGQSQFGWLLYINNPTEDSKPPQPDLSRVTYSQEMKDEDHLIRVFVPITDEFEEGLSGYGTLQQYDSNQSVYDYADYDFATKSLIYEFTIRAYHASGPWTFREFTTSDLAENYGRFDLKDKAINFSVANAKPDQEKPTLDLSAIKIKAVPRTPEAPNGETDVSIWYRARDDNSGLGWVDYQLLKPTGDTLFDYHYHDNFHTPYFVGDPTANQLYEIKLTLPPGSVPGTWILQQLVIKDKAGNTLTSNFIETGILKPFEVR